MLLLIQYSIHQTNTMMLYGFMGWLHDCRRSMIPLADIFSCFVKLGYNRLFFSSATSSPYTFQEYGLFFFTYACFSYTDYKGYSMLDFLQCSGSHSHSPIFATQIRKVQLGLHLMLAGFTPTYACLRYEDSGGLKFRRASLPDLSLCRCIQETKKTKKA